MRLAVFAQRVPGDNIAVCCVYVYISIYIYICIYISQEPRSPQKEDLGLEGVSEPKQDRCRTTAHAARYFLKQRRYYKALDALKTSSGFGISGANGEENGNYRDYRGCLWVI